MNKQNKHKNKTTLFLKLFSIIAAVAMLFSQCIKPKECDSYLFNDDEFQWIDWPDSAYFLINGTDTVFKEFLKARAVSMDVEECPLNKNYGDNSIAFREPYDLVSFASVDISKPRGFLKVKIYIHPTHNLPITFTPSQGTIDTSTINGIFYCEVYKFKGDSVDDIYTKSVEFSKQFGFLKIELNNGFKIELLSSSN